MRIAITSSSRDEIDNIYKDESKKVIEYLADQGCELNWGSGDQGIMGVCYTVFNNKGNIIHGYTTPGYVDKLENLKNATHEIYDDTFDLKKNLFNDSDIIICLPGGIGTVSEVFSYLEENRSNANNKKIILYNINGWFDYFIDGLKELIINKFSDSNLLDNLLLVNSYDEFINEYNKTTV